jgi:hypothetical protein
MKRFNQDFGKQITFPSEGGKTPFTLILSNDVLGKGQFG